MSANALELLPIDISRWAAGNTGVPYVTTIDSGSVGPHVLLMALTHGNELCGAHVLDYLLDQGVQPTRGRLTFAFGNVAAYERFDPSRPSESRFLDEDMNRVWSPEILDGPRQSREIARARALRPIVETADYLLDIHSMQTGAPPLVLCGVQAKGRRLASEVGVPPLVVADAGHKAGPRMRDFGAFSDDASPKTALLVECGQHWKMESRAVALDTTLRFLTAVDIVDPHWAVARLGSRAVPQRFIRVTQAVTITSSDFRFHSPFEGMEVIPNAGTVIANDGERDVATPYDNCVLIMPSRRMVVGQTAVRFGRFEA
jgi:predicted deacylase